MIPKLDERARRKLLALGTLSLFSLLPLATQFLLGREPSRILFHLVYLVVGLPVLMVSLSVGYSYATKRHLGAVATILSGLAIAGVLGTAVGATMWSLSGLFPRLRPRPDTAWQLARAVQFGFLYGLTNYALWALAFVFPFAVEDARIRALEAETLRLEAERLRSDAELARLRAHLEPHFLLNTLNAIAGFVTDDPREARRLLVCLGDLLRDALKDDGEMQALEDEVRWLRRYAEILEARHAGQLTFEWNIADEARSAMVPRLLLQPLVENAVKHGALKGAGEGLVTVSAEIAGEPGASRLVCVVEDNGPGITTAETRAGAFGLHAVRRRLELKFADAATLRLESTGSGTRSIVELPCASPYHRASVPVRASTAIEVAR